MLATADGAECLVRDAADGALRSRWSDPVSALAFSRDGAVLAIGSREGVSLHDPAGGRQLARRAARGVLALAFSPDGRHVLAGHGSGDVRLLDGATLRPVAAFQAAHGFPPPGGGGAGVRWVAFAADGHTALSAGNERAVRTWSVPDGAPGPTWTYAERHALGSFVASSPDGRHVAVGGTTGPLSRWDRDTGEVLPARCLPTEVALLDRGRGELLVASRTGVARLGDDGEVRSRPIRWGGPMEDLLANAEERAAFPLTGGVTRDVPARSRDGRWLALPLATEVNLVGADGVRLARIPCDGRARGAIFGADGQWLVVVDTGANVWSVGPAPVRLARVALDWGKLEVRGLAISEGGTLVISADTWDNHFTADSALLFVDLASGAVTVLRAPDEHRLGGVGCVGGARFAVVDDVGGLHVAEAGRWLERRPGTPGGVPPHVRAVLPLTAERGRAWHLGLGGCVHVREVEPGEELGPPARFGAPPEPPSRSFAERLAGQRFLFLGRFERSTKALRDSVVELGATVARDADARVTHVVIAVPQYGDHVPSRAEQVVRSRIAAGAPIQVSSEGKLLQLLLPTPAETGALLRGAEGGRERWSRWIARARAKWHDLALSLVGADLEGLDLSGLDLRYANLAHARLRGADLTRTQLERADLRRADLRDAHLDHTNVYQARLEGADLTGATIPTPLYAPISDDTTVWPKP